MSPPFSSSNWSLRVRKPSSVLNPIPSTNAPLFLSDHSLYGSARLGQRQQPKIVNQSYVPPGTNNLVEVTYVQRGWKAYELSNHLGNVLSVISDRREAGQCNDTLVAFYDPDMIQNNDYYPFGAPMEGRRQQSRNYRYGFNGQEQDNEVYGDGNSYTAEFWQYDSRLGRRWNVDLMFGKYPHQSPYSSLNNNPVYYVDPFGAEGEATVDKENRTVTITANFYYDKTNPEFSRNHITEGLNITIGTWAGTEIKSELTLIQENGWGAQSWTISDEDGNEWTINYNVNFIGLDNEAAVEQKLKDEPWANKLAFDDHGKAGEWNSATRTLTLGGGFSPDGLTSIHEVGHALGLPHAYDMPESPFYGRNDKHSPGYNGIGEPNGEIMSYASNRSLQIYEVRMTVMKSIHVANSVSDNVVRIHILGSPSSAPRIIESHLSKTFSISPNSI